MKKLICVLLCLLFLTGCVSSEKKQTVKSTLENYFSALKLNDFEKANSFVLAGEENISAEIEKSSVNDIIFKDISYDIWNISENDGLLCADIVVTQISLQSAYIDTVKEYALYVEEAKAQNKVFTDEALENKWNEIFYKHVSKAEDKISLRCDVYIKVEENKAPAIIMTADFRNCLFGGELDAIKALQKG